MLLGDADAVFGVRGAGMSRQPQPVTTPPQVAAFLKSMANISEERRECIQIAKEAIAQRDLLLGAVWAIRNIKDSIPFDASDAATECIRIAKEAIAQLLEREAAGDARATSDPQAVQAESEKGGV